MTKGTILDMVCITNEQGQKTWVLKNSEEENKEHYSEAYRSFQEQIRKRFGVETEQKEEEGKG